MFKRLFLVLVLCFMVSFVGCATISSIPMNQEETPELSQEIMDRYEVVVVKTRDVIAPSSTTVMIYDKESGTMDKVEGGTGASALGQVAGPAATAFAGYRIGKGLEDSGDESLSIMENNSGSKAAAGAGAASGSISGAAVIQPPPRDRGGPLGLPRF